MIDLVDLKNIITLDEFTEKVNDKCKMLQKTEKEVVSDECAFEALYIIKNMYIEDAGDALLYCASVNLLNTYVKQENRKIGYFFKSEINYITSVILNKDIKDVYVDLQENGNLLVIQIFNLQFSFHFIRKEEDIKKLCDSDHYKKMQWDGIRKQNCAVTLVRLVRENNIRFSTLTYRNKKLSDNIDKTLNLYNEGKISFKDLIN